MVDQVDVTAQDGQQYTIPIDKLQEAQDKYHMVPVAQDVGAAEMQDQVKAEDIGTTPGTYNVVKDGQQYVIPTDKLPEATQKYGMKLASQAAAEKATAAAGNEHAARVQYWVNDLKNGATNGNASTFLRGYADEMLAGGAQKAEDWIASKLYDIKQTPEQQKENEAYAEAIKKVNDEQALAHGVGAVAGFAGQTFLGSKMAGAVGKVVNPLIEGSIGMGATITNPILQAAAKEAIAGAVTVSPQAMAQAVIDQDPKGAAESLLIGLGTGGILGAGLKGLSRAGSKATESVINATTEVPEAKIIELNMGEKTLLDKLGVTRSMRRTIGDAEDQNRILKVLAKHFGEGDVDAGQQKMLSMSREELALEVKKLTAENGPLIGEIRKTLDKAIEEHPELRPPIVPIAEDIEKLKAGLISPEEKAVVDHATKFLVDKMKDSTNTFKDFTEADKVKSYFQKLAKFDKNSSAVTDPVKHKIAGIVREHVDNAAAEIAKVTQTPKVIENWTNYKALYGIGKSLDLAADNVLNAPVTHEFIPGGHGALGAGYLGHVIGAAAGIPVVGPVLGVVGAKLAKNYLREGGIAKAAYWLGGRIQDPAISSYVAVDAVKAISTKLEEMPRFIKSLAEAGAARAYRSSKPPVSNSIKDVLGEEANGLSKEQQFHRLAEKVAAMKANPAAMQKNVADHVEGLSQHHAQLAQDLTVGMMKKLEYLYSILPKNPNQPAPFRHDPEWKPSAAQINDFQKQLAVANDPFHVLEELKAGTLTAPQVAVLAAINPDLLQKMRGEVIKLSMEKNVKLPYQQRVTMGVLLGEKIDAGLMALPLPQGPVGNSGQKPTKPGKKMSLKQDHLPDYRTSFRKAMEK